MFLLWKTGGIQMTRTDKYAQHETLRAKSKPLFQKAFRSMSLYTRHVGNFYIRRILAGGSAVNYTPIKIEKKGRCDDWFVLPCKLAFHASIPDNYYNIILPIHGEIETKTGKAVLSPDQIKWRDKCFRKGILWFENRDPQTTINNINAELQKRGLVPWTNL